MAARSLAVHPKNSSIVLRAGGRVVNGDLKSGLWKSQDGGKSWKLVTREIDFDGRGPTTLFGEVMMFGPQDPNLVAAGGETKGLFISRDAGETWTSAGPFSGNEQSLVCFTTERSRHWSALPRMFLAGESCTDIEDARKPVPL